MPINIKMAEQIAFYLHNGAQNGSNNEQAMTTHRTMGRCGKCNSKERNKSKKHTCYMILSGKGQITANKSLLLDVRMEVRKELRCLLLAHCPLVPEFHL